MDTVEIKVGQWLVWNDASWISSEPRYVCSKVVKATEKTVTYQSPWGGDRRRNIDGKEVWCGPEADAKALTERLNSSAGLAGNERLSALERHHDRAVKLVAAATQEAGRG